jgi:hyperosmotically inducible periplasmic protein
MRTTIRIAALAVASMFLATGCNVMRGDQDTGAYVDDAALTARVKAALLDDEQVSGTRFDVNVFQGKVTLGGVTSDPAEARRAEQIARDVEGVKSVESNIRVAEADTSSGAASDSTSESTSSGSTSSTDTTGTTPESETTPPESTSTPESTIPDPETGETTPPQ